MSHRVLMQDKSRLVVLESIHVTFDEKQLVSLCTSPRSKINENPLLTARTTAPATSAHSASASARHVTFADIDQSTLVSAVKVPSALPTAAASHYHDAPKSYKQALQGPDAQAWQDAVTTENGVLITNNTFTLCDRAAAKGKTIVKSKYVLRIKYGTQGTIERYKARLVALGYTQKEGIDFHDVFAPVTTATTIRTIFALAASLDLELHHMDVTAAFLYSDERYKALYRSMVP